ncbi:unnamed protein product, partial [Discosporangium mesarthrocarpum]
LLTSSNDARAVSLLCDSGANVHLTPRLEDLTSPRTVNRTCTFGNKGKLEAKAVGEMALEVTDDKAKTTSLMLQGVLWVPGLPCRLLSKGCVRRKRGEFVDSGIRRSYIKPVQYTVQYVGRLY